MGREQWGGGEDKMLKKKEICIDQDIRWFVEMTPSAAAGGTVIADDGGAAWLHTMTHNILAINHSRTGPHTVITHRNVDQVGDGVDKRPDPLAVGLRIDGAGRRADGRTPRALLGLGVNLHKMKGPKQVLWVANLWEEGVPVKQLPYSFDDEHARP